MNKRILHISLFLMLASTSNVLAQQGIGTNTPYRSAALQIESQNKGILIPRMNLGYDAVNNKITSNISSPVQGLLVYNQTSITNVPEGFYYYSDGKWNPISKSYLENSAHTTISGDGTVTPYKVELKPATASQLGGVKIGQNINVSTDGTISVSFPASTVDTNTTTTVSTDQSYVNVDLTQTVGQDSDPINTRNYKIGVKPATTSTLGVVQPGTGLTVNDGVLNVNTSNTGIGKTLTGSGITVTASSSGEITNSVANSVLADVTLGIADNAVTSIKILDETIGTADLANKSVTATKLDAGTGVDNRLAIADATGNVTYSTISTSILTGAGNLTSTTGDNSITVTDGNGATLKNTNIKVSDLGISTAKLAADAVTSAKILDGTIATADLDNNAVTSAKIANGTIIADDLANKSVIATKLDAGTGVDNRLAIADATGNVTYSTISTSILTGAGNLTSTTGDNSITVTDGNGATLKNTNIKVSDLGISTAKLAADAVTSAKILDGTIATADLDNNAVTSAKIANGTIIAEDLANKSVIATKLDAGTGVDNRLAIADATGNVTYSTISTSILTGAGNLTSTTGDNSITVTDGNGATLKNTNIKVSDLGISTAKLAADAVTSAKILDGTIATADLDNNAVTTTKVASGSNNTVLSTNDTGIVEWIDKSSLDTDTKTKVVAGTNITVTPTTDPVNTSLNTYTINVATATTTTLGVVKPGTGMKVDANGTLTEADYSSTERDTGRKWIDNKIVYERVDTIVLAETNTYTLPVENRPSKILSIRLLGADGSVTTELTRYNFSTGVMVFGTGRTAFSQKGQQYHLILEYIK